MWALRTLGIRYYHALPDMRKTIHEDGLAQNLRVILTDGRNEMIQHFTTSTTDRKVKRTACGRNNRGFQLVSTINPENVDCGSCLRWLKKAGK